MRRISVQVNKRCDAPRFAFSRWMRHALRLFSLREIRETRQTGRVRAVSSPVTQYGRIVRRDATQDACCVNPATPDSTPHHRIGPRDA